MPNIYPRESVEFVSVLVTADNNPVTSGVQFAVTKPSARPDSLWFDASILDGMTGFYTGSYGVGPWKVWAKVSDAPETPVIDCGSFQVS